MKPYSIELRERIVKIYEQGDTSIRKVVARFDVSKGFVQKILKRKDSGLKEGNKLRHTQVTKMGRNSLTEKSHY